MNELKVVLLTRGAKAPVRAHAYDAGLDVFADQDVHLYGLDTPAIVRTGIAIEVQPGFQATVLPKSSLSMEGIHVYTGTVDAGYTGELKVCVQLMIAGARWHIGKGTKIAQLVITRVELPTVRVVDELEQHGTRGANGWGSTGNR